MKKLTKPMNVQNNVQLLYWVEDYRTEEYMLDNIFCKPSYSYEGCSQWWGNYGYCVTES